MRELFLLFCLFPLCLCKCDEGFFNSSGTCCKLCPAGTFMKNPCTSSRETECQECGEGKFTDTQTKARQCKPCRICDNTQVTSETCSKTQDTQCACPDGKYWRVDLLFCDECSQCPAGQGAVGRCQGSKNNQCHDCIKGVTFSNTSSYQDSCQLCTTCGGKTLQPCSETSDSICEKVESSEKPTNAISVPPTGTAIRGPRESPRYVYVIVGVLAAVVLVLIVITAICWQFRHRRGQNTNTPDFSNVEGDPDDISMTNDDDRVMVRDLPGHVVMEIEEKLNPDGHHNWIQLADRLGATQLDIANYKLVPDKATQKVIESWCVKESATVDELCNALNDIKRYDCVAIVKPYSSLGKTQ